MRAGGDFGNNATVSGENVDLRNYDVTENCRGARDVVITADDGGGGFVTGTFDGENFHRLIIS